MTEKEMYSNLLVIYQSLDTLTQAVKLLMNESEARDEKVGIFKDIDEDVQKFFYSVMKHD